MYYFLKVCSVAVFFLGLTGFKGQENGWHEYLQNDQIKIETSIETCSSAQNGTSNNYIFIRISNKTNLDLEVSFDKELWYNDVCSNCNGGDEAKTTLVLHANETVEGTCESSFKTLKIFHSMAKGSKRSLSKFDLKNLTVTPVEQK